MPQLPSGAVTFPFTDIEGSTRLVKQLRDGYPAVLADHQRLLRAVPKRDFAPGRSVRLGAPAHANASDGDGQVEMRGVSDPCSTTTQPSYSANRYGAFMGTTVDPDALVRKLPQSASRLPFRVSHSS